MIVADTRHAASDAAELLADRLRPAPGRRRSRRRARAEGAAARARVGGGTSRCRSPRTRATPDPVFRERAGGGRGRDPHASLRRRAARAARNPGGRGPAGGTLTVWASTQTPHVLQGILVAASLTHVDRAHPRHRLRRRRRVRPEGRAVRRGHAGARSPRGSSAARCAGSKSAARTWPRRRTRATRSIASASLRRGRADPRRATRRGDA